MGTSRKAIPTLGALPAEAVEGLGWASYFGGLLGALVVLSLPVFAFVFSYFTTLVHEMGHAAAGWLFGYPSIPSFDFVYGGGVTLQQERVRLLVAGLVVAGAWAVWALRAQPPLRNAALALLLGYFVFAATSAHEAVILAMGHGGELAFATLFLHRALSGRGCRMPLERPLYGLLGWFIVLSAVAFAWRLITSETQRALYAAAKGGGHWMDFSRLAEEFLDVRLETVAAVFLLLCLVPPVASILLQRALARDAMPTD